MLTSLLHVLCGLPYPERQIDQVLDLQRQDDYDREQLRREVQRGIEEHRGVVQG